jgi:hypothetical protein
MIILNGFANEEVDGVRYGISGFNNILFHVVNNVFHDAADIIILKEDLFPVLIGAENFVHFNQLVIMARRNLGRINLNNNVNNDDANNNNNEININNNNNDNEFNNTNNNDDVNNNDVNNIDDVNNNNVNINDVNNIIDNELNNANNVLTDNDIENVVVDQNSGQTVSQQNLGQIINTPQQNLGQIMNTPEQQPLGQIINIPDQNAGITLPRRRQPRFANAPPASGTGRVFDRAALINRFSGHRRQNYFE